MAYDSYDSYKYGRDDRRRMLVPGCGFDFEHTPVYSTAAGAGGK